MRKTPKLPRILKIKSREGFKISCIFNNGETRMIDFQRLFRKWKVAKSDPEYLLKQLQEFKKVGLRNQTLSWGNVQIPLCDFNGNQRLHPYELSPDLLYRESTPVPEKNSRFHFGRVIRKTRLRQGLTQQQLADLSGTSKTYISRIENDLIEPEFSTLYKIVSVGLGRKIKVEIC